MVDIRIISQCSSFFSLITKLNNVTSSEVNHAAVPWHSLKQCRVMVTSSNGNIFRVTDPLLREFTGHKGQWRGALTFSLIYVWTNGWVNNRDTGDSRHYRAHSDVTVMVFGLSLLPEPCNAVGLPLSTKKIVLKMISMSNKFLAQSSGHWG